MADIQLLTGLAILTSGFASLRNGLSTYHWQIVVYLAWLSSLTHLTTLTFLRHYLHCRNFTRSWRLVAMFVLIIMLVVALVPTASFDWDEEWDEDDAPHAYAGSYAICYFLKAPTGSATSLVSMIVSVVAIFFSFVARIIRLYEVPSKSLRSLKDKVHGLLINLLGKVRENANDSSTPARKLLRMNLMYHPARALVSMCRCAWIIYSSLLWVVRTAKIPFLHHLLATDRYPDHLASIRSGLGHRSIDCSSR